MVFRWSLQSAARVLHPALSLPGAHELDVDLPRVVRGGPVTADMDDQVASSISQPMQLRGLAAGAGVACRRVTSDRLVAAVAYVLAALTSLAVVSFMRAAIAPAALAAAGAAGLLTAVAIARRGDHVRRASLLWACLLTAFASTCLLLLSTGALPERSYGDGALFARFVADGRAVPRWLIGSAAAVAAHAALWDLPPVYAHLPEPLRSPSSFLAVLGSVVMVLGTWALVQRWRGRLCVVLPLLTPVWVLFASGYVEYYPLIAAPFVATLAWLFERPLEDRTPEQIGLLAAVLPLLYVGFLPTACLMMAAWIAVRPARALQAAVVAVAVAAVTIAVCWPEGLASYFRTLYSVLNFGDAHLPPRYAGQVASPTSIMFAVDAVWSWPRAREVAYLLVWGGGWWSLPVMVAATCRAWHAIDSRRGAALRDVRTWLGAALVTWHLYYLAFMVPRLGPTADVDLFFPTYLTVAFVAGLLLDTTRTARTPTWAAATLACALAALACVGPWLVWFGLPPAP
jgi:hypothetical protein